MTPSTETAETAQTAETGVVSDPAASGASRLRLTVVDMDGTLLDPEGRVPAGLDDLLARLRAAGVAFVPASGRQHATLEHMFPAVPGGWVVAENGAVLAHEGRVVATSPMPVEVVRGLVERLRAHAAGGADIGVVVCAADTAYVERVDERFLAQCAPYYRALARVEDLLDHLEQVVKVAVHDFGDPQVSAQVMGEVPGEKAVVVSGAHWVDAMATGVDKGRAVADLQARLGIEVSETAAFGDARNDLEMLDRAAWSYAVANAHPDVRARARYAAPSNAEGGVLTVLGDLLDRH